MIPIDHGYAMLYQDLWLDLTPILTIDKGILIDSQQLTGTPENNVRAVLLKWFAHTLHFLRP